METKAVAAKKVGVSGRQYFHVWSAADFGVRAGRSETGLLAHEGARLRAGCTALRLVSGGYSFGLRGTGPHRRHWPREIAVRAGDFRMGCEGLGAVVRVL